MTAPVDTYEGPDEPTHSSKRVTAVTPSDSTDFTDLPIAIYVGGAGNVVVVNHDNSTATFVAVPAGTVLPVRPRRINATLTTATYLVALY